MSPPRIAPLPRALRRLAAGALVAGLGLAAAPAFADHRDFAGKVKGVSSKDVTVENRRGDRRSFVRGKKTKVRGGAGSWEGLRPGDEVIVDWHLEDRPARARRVRVIAPPPGK
jgi:hypothetical protein